MRKHYIILLLSLFLIGAAPSRQATYTAGTVISPTDVTSNEDVIFAYLQAGVDTYVSGSVNSAAIANGTILNADIASNAAIDFSKFATLTSGNILVGDSSNVATSVAMSGDVAISNTGATTIQANSVALTTDTTGSYAAGDGEAGNATGLVCTTCVDTTDINSNAVTGTKIALGSDAQGDVMYYNGTDYVRLAPGTSGNFLQTQGASANPQWAGVNFEVGYIREVLTDGGTGTDVSVTLDIQSRVVVMVECTVSSNAATTPQLSIRRDTTDKITIPQTAFDIPAGGGCGGYWSETLAAGTYAFDFAALAISGTETYDYSMIVLAVPNT